MTPRKTDAIALTIVWVGFGLIIAAVISVNLFAPCWLFKWNTLKDIPARCTTLFTNQSL
jgi:hypothetical protein